MTFTNASFASPTCSHGHRARVLSTGGCAQFIDDIGCSASISANTSCSANGLDAYHELRTRQAAIRVLDMVKFLLPFQPPIFALQMHFNGGLSMYHFILWVGPIGILLTCTSFADQIVRRWLIHKPVLVGCALQAVIYLLFVCICVSVAPLMPSELMQHRIFLTTIIPISAWFPIIGYMPFWIGLFCFCPVYVTAWIAFHINVGFLRPPVVLWVFIHCAAICCTFLFVDRSAWNNFQATRELHKERQLLESTQTTLHCMLSSLFDASCICDRHGQLLVCTPQLQQLLVGDKSLVGSNFRSFAESPEEVTRLRQFLDHAAETSIKQASTIQLSMCSDSTTLEVKLYAIVLPGGVGQWIDDGAPHHETNRDEVGLFVGLQAQASAPGTANETAAPAQHKDEILSAHCIFGESLGGDEISDAEMLPDIVPSPSSKREMCQVAISSKPCSLSQECDALSVCSAQNSLASCSFPSTWSLAYSSSLHSSSHQQLQRHGRNRSCPEVANMESQTVPLLMHTQETQTQEWPAWSPCRKPPALPRHKLTKESSKRNITVRLNTSRCVLSRFKATEEQTLKFLIYEAMSRSNPRGSGCCAYHVCLYAYFTVIRSMLQGPCERAFAPRCGWQCEHCLALNGHGPDSDSADESDEEGATACAICGLAKPWHNWGQGENSSTVQESLPNGQTSAGSD